MDNLVGKVADDLRNRFEIAAEQLRHPGEKGRSREDVVRGFISQYIPARFSLGSGIVVDTGREESAQSDLVIYDQFVARPFRISEGVELFPVEGVCAVGEVKSTLDSRNLKDALKKIARAKALDKTSGGENRMYVGGGHMGRMLSRRNFFDQVFGFVFGFRGPKLTTLMNTLHEFNQGVDRDRWVNIICILDRGLVAYANGRNDLLVEPRKARRITTLETRERSLLIFLQELFYFLQVSHSAEPNLSFYGWTGSVDGSDIKL
ncbi:MAG: hypothetical protein E6K04_00700 [Methanobacteriota archaeon]|nr:MAG: hypothetical protein E6K04_00700 [Euryarchaeota archaeon]